jgi:CHAT domain-containing protein
VLVLGGAGAAQYLGEADIAAASLEEARWVVLSACDTGLGDSRAYEGAFGLRRAFHLAGARTVIMSLWRVDDAATADWMAALYAARFEHGAGAADAVAAAQRATLTARRAAGLDPHPYYWAAFISAGDWR